MFFTLVLIPSIWEVNFISIYGVKTSTFRDPFFIKHVIQKSFYKKSMLFLRSPTRRKGISISKNKYNRIKNEGERH